MAERLGGVLIEGVEPQVDGGRYAVKRQVGVAFTVRADVFKEGHGILTAVVRWRQESPAQGPWAEAPLTPIGNDRWETTLRAQTPGLYRFVIEAWPNVFRTWADELQRKLTAGNDCRSERLEGAALLRQAAFRARAVPSDEQELERAAEALENKPALEANALAADSTLAELASRWADRSVATSTPAYPIRVEVERARAGAWYELFPRSASGDGKRHGTFKDVERRLPELAALGFDVLYLPPIHPIGRTARKGKNNARAASPGDVGSPWAIGAQEGGHKSVHPELGTLEDFSSLVRAASAHDLDLALDLAFQCAPDHPYVKEHPEWFQHRPDGTIKTAENPPKRYDDIVNFDYLGPGREALWAELKSVVLFWVQRGVRIFRVDNPHTKPFVFWEWLLAQVHAKHPDVVFLSEAFTRPKPMKALAKLGFSQSYTYFTWRNFKEELTEYLTELTQTDLADSFHGNLWPNTPDILHEFLQRGGPPAFRLRYALAATLSSSFGIYSGYEFCVGAPVPGSEEYLDSEKYQLWSHPPAHAVEDIRPFIQRINAVRRAHPALRLYQNLRFHDCDSSQVLWYGKASPDGQDIIWVAVSLDPHSAHEVAVQIPHQCYGLKPLEQLQVTELLTERTQLWSGETAQVRLTPDEPVALFRPEPFRRTEQSFEYYGPTSPL